MRKPSGSRSSMPAHLRPISVNIPAVWTPEQALAVLDLLDDLRETVAALYLDQMQAHLRQERCGDDTATDGDADAPASDDLTF